MPRPVVATPHEAVSRRPDDACSNVSASCATCAALAPSWPSSRMQNSSPPSRNASRAFDVRDRVAERARHRDQRLVTGVVAEAVVHLFHAVDVEHEK